MLNFLDGKNRLKKRAFSVLGHFLTSGCSVGMKDASRDGGSRAGAVSVAMMMLHCLHAHGLSRRSEGPLDGRTTPVYGW